MKKTYCNSRSAREKNAQVNISKINTLFTMRWLKNTHMSLTHFTRKMLKMLRFFLLHDFVVWQSMKCFYHNFLLVFIWNDIIGTLKYDANRHWTWRLTFRKLYSIPKKNHTPANWHQSQLFRNQTVFITNLLLLLLILT